MPKDPSAPGDASAVHELPEEVKAAWDLLTDEVVEVALDQIELHSRLRPGAAYLAQGKVMLWLHEVPDEALEADGALVVEGLRQ